jgi:hypothetical protein
MWEGEVNLAVNVCQPELHMHVRDVVQPHDRVLAQIYGRNAVTQALLGLHQRYGLGGYRIFGGRYTAPDLGGTTPDGSTSHL